MAVAPETYRQFTATAARAWVNTPRKRTLDISVAYTTPTARHHHSLHAALPRTMDDFNSDTDSDYTSYWRDWVGALLLRPSALVAVVGCTPTGPVS